MHCVPVLMRGLAALAAAGVKAQSAAAAVQWGLISLAFGSVWMHAALLSLLAHGMAVLMTNVDTHPHLFSGHWRPSSAAVMAVAGALQSVPAAAALPCQHHSDGAGLMEQLTEGDCWGVAADVSVVIAGKAAAAAAVAAAVYEMV